MTILIVTKSDDNECVDWVKAALERRGETVFRFDTDLFPSQTRLILEHGPDGDEYVIVTEQEELELQEVTAVWFRRMDIGRHLAEDLDPQIRSASILESRRTVLEMLESLDAFAVDPIPHIGYAQNRALQLRIAQLCGLAIPRTLTTNDPEAVRAFAQSCAGRIATRMWASSGCWHVEDEAVTLTDPVTRQELEDLSGLDLGPMTFQEQMEKAMEIRTVIIGDRIFTAAIEPQSTQLDRFDWRRDGLGLLGDWKTYELPDELAGQLLEIMDFFELNYSTIDLVAEPDGNHRFLELNPLGEYLWLERALAFPISDALAEVLLGLAPRRGMD